MHILNIDEISMDDNNVNRFWTWSFIPHHLFISFYVFAIIFMLTLG